ncbi:hypothetical protein M407DRAFT_245183 [Tulasnella calospora MUT 4182]|uniref:Uncharacterized protein n=1 Tax=Tulasnella calospora MUT 4182 TaxID=1051891 RepID=A0A0C3Q232_9AGAM|nr:hypothetical protein M407DRAFT_245183 [Tulasnella calospora MUT 4182]
MARSDSGRMWPSSGQSCEQPAPEACVENTVQWLPPNWPGWIPCRISARSWMSS